VSTLERQPVEEFDVPVLTGDGGAVAREAPPQHQ
jgi:hypothetical protein